jgi:TonB-linked SusC/RagA family outer membrane protein
MKKSLLLLLGILIAFSQLFAQNRTVTGTVTDQTNNPLSGVSVVALPTGEGTSTNEAGKFTLAVTGNAKSLQFSSVNFGTTTVDIGAKTSFDVALSPTTGNLSEVVVTAFGIKRDKKTLGYGVTQLNTEELTQARTTNVTNALAGKVPGVRISGAGGAFTGSSIVIRGFTTFTGSNQPLFVIDGIPFDNGGGAQPLQAGAAASNRAIDINQDDIENMSILKGPAAAALYGSRAANGVILITTKKGRFNQKNNVQFTHSYAVEHINRLPEYQNQYAQGNNGLYNNTAQTSWGPLITGQTVNNWFGQQETLTAYPNNVRDIFQTGENFQNNVAFSGGSEKNTFRFSYGNNIATGIIPENRLVRHNIALNTTSKITDKLTASVSVNFVNNKSKRTQQGNQLSSPLFRGYFTPRSYDLTNLPFEDAVGNQRYFGGEDNPYWTIKHNRYTDEINRVFGSAALSYKFNNAIQADYRIGNDQYTLLQHGYDQVGARGGANTSAGAAGGVLEARNLYRSLNSNGFITLSKKVSDFNLTAIVGNEISQIYRNNLQTIGHGVIVRDFENLVNTTTYSVPQNVPNPNLQSQVRLIGVYGDFTAAYRSIASLNLTLRNDWSSTFKQGNRSYLYNAVAASVNITELVPELKGNVLDNLKIRGNIAKVGKAGTDFVYGTDSYFSSGSYLSGWGYRVNFPFAGLQAFGLDNTAGDPELGPEFTTNKEIAIEGSLFKSRLTFEATLYNQKSESLIFSVPVSPASGIANVTQNAGSLRNTGIEMSVTVVPVKTTNFTWASTFNFTQFKSKVEELATGVQNIFLGGFTTPNIRLVEGEEYGQIYGNAYQRDPKTGKMIVGANGLPLITAAVQNIGNPNPKWLLGINNTFSYKGLSLSFLLDIKKGGQQYSRNIADVRRNGVAIETAEFPRFNADGTVAKPYLFDAVTANGEANTTYVSAQDYWGNSGVFAAAEGFIVETSWFRVREAALTYKLPRRLTDKTPFGNTELSIFGRNLYLRAPNYPHLDPEQNALGVSNAQGLEFNALPQTRSVGVSLRFSL